MGFSNRVFGDDIPLKIKKTLEARQKASRGPKYKGQYYRSDYGPKVGDTYDDWLNTDYSGFIADLSSRTPWARMWSAIDVNLLSPVLKNGNEILEEDGLKNPKDNQYYDHKSGHAGGKKWMELKKLKSHIYVIGNHIYNSMTKDGQENFFEGIVYNNKSFKRDIPVEPIRKEVVQENYYNDTATTNGLEHFGNINHRPYDPTSDVNVYTKWLQNNKKKCFLEVKNVTLFRNKNTAEFPDAVTSRGTKHLLTLIDAIKKGYKSYLLFLVQIQNMEKFKIAKDIDNEYYKNYLIAKKAGVNFLAYRCDISSKKIFIEKKLKIIDA